MRSHKYFHPPCALLTLTLIVRKIRPLLSLVDREVESLCTYELIVFHLRLLSMMSFIFVKENPSSSVAPRFELTSLRQKVSRLQTEPPERPVEL